MTRRRSAHGLCKAGAAVLALATMAYGASWVGHLGQSSVNPLTGRVTVRDVGLSLPDGGSIRIGEVTWYSGWALIPPAMAAENVALRNVAIDAAGVLYVAPSVEISASSLSQKDWTALQDPRNSGNFVGRLATLSASAINIPELRIEHAAGVSKRVFDLRKVVLRNVAAGKAATVAAEGGTMRGPVPVDARFGAVAGRALDLALLAKLLSAKPVPEREARPLYAAFTVDKAEFSGNDGIAIRIEQLSSVNAKAQPGDQPQHLLSVLGTLKATDWSIDVPSRGARGQASRWTVKEFALQADDPRDGVPTKYRIAIDRLGTVLPGQSSDPSIASLIDLGFSTLEFSAVAEADWNPQSSQFQVRRLSVEGANIGSIALRASFGKVTKDVFFAKQAPLDQMTVLNMNLAVENKGLYERLVMREAKKQGKSLEQTRREFQLASMIYTNAMLERAPSGDVVQLAIAKFFQNPGKLNISATAKSAGGVPWSEMGGKSAGPEIGSKFNVSAVAE